MFGFGILGQGFDAIVNILECKVNLNQASGLVMVLGGEANEVNKLEKYLKNLIKDDWIFKLERLISRILLIKFPDKGPLKTISKFAGFWTT